MATRILVVDDDAALRRAVRRALTSRGYEVVEAAGGREAVEHVTTDPTIDLVLLDLVMPDLDGLGVLRAFQEAGRRPATIMVSATGTIGTAVEAMRLGAVDFVEKGGSQERLLVSVANALRFRRLERAHARLLDQIPGVGRMLGASKAMDDLRHRIGRVARTESRVLVLGENGTGKELVARMVHEGSRRASGPFVTLNCAAVPADLVESELFGHEAGAFTGAKRAHAGRFERAHEGTLFLDEVGDMPMPMQAKLLRVLQEGELERVGGAETRKIDVRIVAATNQDLLEGVRGGTFREDLYYRLAVMVIHTPPLRERLEDVPELVERFRATSAERNGLRPPEFTEGALAALTAFDWPGNVRQLQNVVERLVILCDDVVDERAVQLELPPPAARRPAARAEPGPSGAPAGRQPLSADDDARLDPMVAERERLVLALERAGQQRQRAAELLGMSRSTLWRKLKQHGLE